MTPTPDTSPEAVEATPEDRKAAEDALFVLRGFRTRIPSLKHSVVQAFARHRIAAEAEAAALREALRAIVFYETSDHPERGDDICEHYFPLKEIARAALGNERDGNGR